MNGTCLYCNKQNTPVYQIESWNNYKTKYYCEKHYQEVKTAEQEEKRQFWKYYQSLERREWLSEKQKQIWKKINEEFEGIVSEVMNNESKIDSI